LSPWNRFNCISRAFVTSSRISSDDTPVASDVRSLYWTFWTSTWISILSSRGPEILEI